MGLRSQLKSSDSVSDADFTIRSIYRKSDFGIQSLQANWLVY